MSRPSRLLAIVSAVVLVVMTALPADAAPRPRSDEWWFAAWGVEKYIWPKTKGAGVTVGVLDTGVNASLPELSGVVLRGGDTTGEKSDGRKDLDSKKGGGHGTGMAALIAGQGGGATGFMGIAPSARILPVHAAAKGGDTAGDDEAIAAGIRFAVDHKAEVINISLASPAYGGADDCVSGIQDAVAYAIEHDVVVVAGAGNDGNTTNNPMLPASCAGVLAVGAIDKYLHPWAGSQRQPYVAVAAPGVISGIVGAKDEYFQTAVGTSISSALTSGAIALIRSRNPHMSGRTAVQRLIATTFHTGSPHRNDRTGYGPIQISSAMNPERYPVPASAPNPVYEAYDKWQAARYGPAPRPTAKSSPPAAGQAGKSNNGRSSALPFVLGAAGIGIIAVLVVVILARRRR